ncbi:MAG TPA: hypothetical protein VFA38_06595, partial [Nitrospirales bacterium]|nr:hypothetical protein [Nitrospirales bacterium]
MRVVNIHAQNPPYAFMPAGDRPDRTWTRPDGTMLGAWRREWPVLLGEAVRAVADTVSWEVWQLDARADRPYSCTWDSGISHRLIPAIERTYPWLGTARALGSPALIQECDGLSTDTIVVLHGFRVPFYIELLHHLRGRPVVMMAHGMSIAPITELKGLHRPLTYYRLMTEQLALTAALRGASLITAPSDFACAQIRKVYDGHVERLTMGCDFHYWRPVPSPEAKRTLRERLGVPPDAIVLLTTGNFVPLKRFEPLIASLSDVAASRPFFLII